MLVGNFTDISCSFEALGCCIGVELDAVNVAASASGSISSGTNPVETICNKKLLNSLSINQQSVLTVKETNIPIYYLSKE